MVDLFRSIAKELQESFRFVDALDILLVSVFLYATLAWFQKAASRGILLGLALLTLVYFMARSLDMYLTSLAFHTTFAVLLFVLVVVFQEDLRRLLERVSNFGTLEFGQSQDISLDLDEVVESAFAMASTNTGALIVLKGQEPLERHLSGGVVLDGYVSKPLLFSIFDSKTPGHDGAVVIVRDQVTEFGAHLPISRNTGVTGGRGTRHSAALGISESSDSLTIVVSEEHGDVSVAEAGELKKVNSASDLKQRLQEFFHTTFPAATLPLWRRVFVQHVRLKVLSFALALTAWFVLAHDPHTVQRTFAIPVEYLNLPADLELDETAPSEARITLSGSERHFRFLEPSSLKISLDLSNTDTGFHEVAVAERNIGLPTNVSLYRIEPRIIRLYIRTRETANP